METNANTEIPTSNDAPAIVPRADYCLAQLSDSDLLANTRRLVGSSNQLFAALLAHLAEVEARGVHRLRACSSLYTYCLYELRMSEDAAFRRATAAKLVKRFPALFDAIANGELHLTGLLMLGPHLAEANLLEVLARAKHRTKKEIGELVRALSPLPDVPPHIEPLGPAPARTMTTNANPGWQDFVRSMVPVRELAPGDRPRDWTDGSSPDGGPDADSSPPQYLQPLEPAPARGYSPESVEADSGDSTSVTGPQRYVVQFTTTEEYVAFARGGEHTISNLALRCRAHNTLAAEEDFGRELIERRRGSPKHEAAGRASSAVQER